MRPKLKIEYPPVTVTLREDGTFAVEQAGGLLAICPNQLAAVTIARLLNEWFQKQD